MADPIISGLDRVASRVVQSLHNLFGVQFSGNSEHYVYEATINGTAAQMNTAGGALFNAGIRVTQEADFVCLGAQASLRVSATGRVCTITQSDPTSVVTDAAASAMPDTPFTVLITDGSTDRQLSNEAVDWFAFYGSSGSWQNKWGKPRLFQRNSLISLRIQMLKVFNAAADIRIGFYGFKIYNASALDLTSRRS